MEDVMEDEEVSGEQTTDQRYAAALDSVTAIAQATEEGDADTVARNVAHLKLMLAREDWGPQHDLSVFEDAIPADEP